ncbi:putative nuclease HARBI1 [Heteronotia binoei]|uniref:putative nuclease HARBI1 n=1 Tax=Heteronotia binoei TaxID=13085 RepID=UPI0029302321|nr:putative nuclease HARBI1 [Heteronotia binoei]
MDMRTAVSVEERVAVALWWFANTTNYRLVGNQFGLARSTVAGIVAEVALAMELKLLKKTVHLGQHEQIIAGFAAMGFPQAIGAVDGCHVAIRAPPGQANEYINRKKFYSVLLQGTVDHRGRFTDVVIGHSGKNHDAHVLRCSNLIDLMDAGVWVRGNPTITINGVHVPPVILADSAYPLRRWLMTPYGGNVGPQELRFNTVHSRCRNMVERAFGHLKARWRCIGTLLPVQQENINSVIAACVILHNLCEERGHAAPDESVNSNNSNVANDEAEPDPPLDDERQLQEGRRVRAAITRLIWERRGRRR